MYFFEMFSFSRFPPPFSFLFTLGGKSDGPTESKKKKEGAEFHDDKRGMPGEVARVKFDQLDRVWLVVYNNGWRTLIVRLKPFPS
jgi:hypothetical protein